MVKMKPTINSVSQFLNRKVQVMWSYKNKSKVNNAVKSSCIHRPIK